MPAPGEGTQQSRGAEEQIGLGIQNPLGDTGASMQASVQPARDSRLIVASPSAAQQTAAGAGGVSSGAWLGPSVPPLKQAQAASRQQEVPDTVLSWAEQSSGALQSEAAPQHCQQAPPSTAGASPWPQQLSGPAALPAQQAREEPAAAAVEVNPAKFARASLEGGGAAPAQQACEAPAAAAVEVNPADSARASLEDGGAAAAAMGIVPAQPAQAGLQGGFALHSASVPPREPSAWPTGTAAGLAVAAADVPGGETFVIPDRCLCLLSGCCLSCRVLKVCCAETGTVHLLMILWHRGVLRLREGSAACSAECHILRCYLWHVALRLMSIWHSALQSTNANLPCSEDQEMGEDDLA